LSRFLYQHVKTDLRNRIVGGAYAAGHRVPSESELVASFGVSAITVRRGVRELIGEGILIGRQGRGVFVADSRRIVRALGGDGAASLSDSIRISGRAPGVTPIALRLERADAEVAALLRVRAGTRIYRHERLLLADGEPVARGISHLPRALVARLGRSLPGEFLLEALQKRDVAIDHIDYAIEGGVAEDDDAPLLGVGVGFPLLLVRYTPIAPGGRPILTSCTRSRYDRFTYQISMPMSRGRPRPVRRA
jgi:GntR family transcriptional regulator